MTDLVPIDELRRLLSQNEAAGTRARPWYAFGMHINPEMPSDDPGHLRDHLRAFLLLYPWLRAARGGRPHPSADARTSTRSPRPTPGSSCSPTTRPTPAG